MFSHETQTLSEYDRDKPDSWQDLDAGDEEPHLKGCLCRRSTEELNV
ncbi:MAG: hypothetical protein IPN81_07750 [Nitrosomonadales bacterium]|nr:hypothetical protein [Nitrosomonadales bacterium]